VTFQLADSELLGVPDRDAISLFLEQGVRLPSTSLEALLEIGEVLDYKGCGKPGVIRVSEAGAEALIVKLWYRKPQPTSDLLVPYSVRFRRNSLKLRSRGIVAPEVIGWGSICGGTMQFVSYPALPGEPLRHIAPEIDLASVARYVLRLHDDGIDFRSLHLGNILSNGSDYSLIDVTDCSFSRRPLSLKHRKRRLARFCSHKADSAYLENGSAWREFTAAYCDAAGLDRRSTARLIDYVGLHAGFSC